MLKDIKVQSNLIKNLIKASSLKNELSNFDINKFSKIYIVASGSSKNAAGIAKYIWEENLNIPVIPEFASEFANRNPALNSNDLIVLISQSGETADTYKALQLAKENNIKTLAFTNDKNSKIHKEADYKIFLNAGIELSIAATKSFMAQVINLIIFASEFSNLSIANLLELSESIDDIFTNINTIEEIANSINKAKCITLLARGTYISVVQEGALKIKETSYINANGYPSGEFLHGYFASVDENTPLIAILNKSDKNYNLTINNIKKIKLERNPKLIIIKEDNDYSLNKLFNDAYFINIKSNDNLSSIILSIVVLQLIAYKIAKSLNLNPDKPRSLTKIVSEE